MALPLYQSEKASFDLKKNWLEKKVRDFLFDHAAKEVGLSRKDWEKREIDDRIVAPTSAEIRQFIQENMPSSDASKPQVVKDVTGFLIRKEHDQLMGKVYRDLLKKHNLQIFLAEPTTPRVAITYSADVPKKGPEQAPITIVEFVDFQCPYCKQSDAVLRQVEKTYPGQLKIVTLQFPLPMHFRAEPAAEAALCAHRQGKYWEFRDKIFEKQQLADSDFLHYAKAIGLDQTKFEECVYTHATKAAVNADTAYAEDLGVNGTPTFFINGRLTVADPPFEVFQKMINEELGAAKQDAVVLKDSSPLVGRLDDTTWTEDDMRRQIALALYQQENSFYRLEKNWIEKKVRNVFFDQAAKQVGLSRKDWEKREIDDQIASATESELRQFIKDHVSPSEASKPETIKRISESLARQNHAKKVDDVYQKLLKQHHLDILLAKPSAPHINAVYPADTPLKGASQAPVTIVEFSDFQCPYCKAVQPILHRIEEQIYPGKIKLAARQFPLPFHPRARPAAEAALCAQEQGKYWEYRDKLFEKQELLDDDFKRYAKELKLNSSRFDQCLAEHRYAGRVEQEIKEGHDIGVSGTPTFFVNGRPVVGASFENFKEAIDEELAAAERPVSNKNTRVR